MAVEHVKRCLRGPTAVVPLKNVNKRHEVLASPSHPVVFGFRCETTLTLTPATPCLTTFVRVTTFVSPGVVTVVEGPVKVTVWLGPVLVTATVVGRVMVTVVVAPPVVVVVPVVVF